MSRPPRVLVVEDEQDIAALVKHTLERGGEAIARLENREAVGKLVVTMD